MLKGLDKQLERNEDGGLYLAERIWVPVYGNLRILIMNESHATRYSIHPGADKMYYDLRGLYWWPEMKKDISMYVIAYRQRLPQEPMEIMDREVKKLKIIDREVKIDNKLYFVKEHMEIIDREVKKLKKSQMPIVKGH
nr:putative reverse transcriptase domain-containing protein [Tanacetum cinerariifolium]